MNTLRMLSLAILVAAMSIGSTQAQVNWTSTFEPTPGLPGYHTHTLHLQSVFPMKGFDFACDGGNSITLGGTSCGFTGPLNQVNPVGLPTIYQDYNALFPLVPADVKQDSQFKVVSSTVVVPAGVSEEGPNILQGAWEFAAPIGQNFDVAQVVIPDSGIVHFIGRITTIENGTPVVHIVHNFVPEPSTAILVAAAAIAWLPIRRRKSVPHNPG